jgi:SPP1 family predicted phage head-tail adaptor
MSLAAGSLRHRLQFQSLQRYLDTHGDTVESWETDFECWGSVEPLSVREFLASQAMQSMATARVVVRYRTDVLPTQRIVFRSKAYNIAGALPDKVSGLEYLTIPVSEGVNAGA